MLYEAAIFQSGRVRVRDGEAKYQIKRLKKCLQTLSHKRARHNYSEGGSSIILMMDSTVGLYSSISRVTSSSSTRLFRIIFRDKSRGLDSCHEIISSDSAKLCFAKPAGNGLLAATATRLPDWFDHPISRSFHYQCRLGTLLG